MKKKLNLIFFIDFNENSGLGHLNRCLHLLKYYKSNHITFVTEKKVRIKGIKNINDKFSTVINRKKIYDLANQPKFKYFSDDDDHMMNFDKNLINEIHLFLKNLN